jgi:hypothetical protein
MNTLSKMLLFMGLKGLFVDKRGAVVLYLLKKPLVLGIGGTHQLSRKPAGFTAVRSLS